MEPGGDMYCGVHLAFLSGGSESIDGSAIFEMMESGEGCEGARARLGARMPSSANDRDFRLVLYGIVY